MRRIFTVIKLSIKSICYLSYWRENAIRRCGSLFQVDFINDSGLSVPPLCQCTMRVCACSASYLRRWLLEALLILAVVLSTNGDCPKPCACYVPTEVHCTFRYLTAIPDHIQPAVERINLG